MFVLDMWLLVQCSHVKNTQSSIEAIDGIIVKAELEPSCLGGGVGGGAGFFSGGNPGIKSFGYPSVSRFVHHKSSAETTTKKIQLIHC